MKDNVFIINMLYGSVTDSFMICVTCDGNLIYAKEHKTINSAVADYERLIRSNTQQ